ncbi:MAG: Hsp20/alpha crystallin family protein [Labilithrix sp.]|nr:Hsp20/alpha crystallin family protein [Labilithrix sp.]
MNDLLRRRRPSVFTMQHDVDDALAEYGSPRRLRHDIERLFSEDLSPHAMWMEMDRLLEESDSPPPLRWRLARMFEAFRSSLGMSGRGMGMGMTGMMQTMRETFMPDMEMKEREHEILLTIDLPGVHRDDVEIRVDDDYVLTIRGERRDEQSRQARGYDYTERRYGYFLRSVDLPRSVDTSRIDADLRAGVLEIRAPKLPGAAAGREIPLTSREQRVGNGGRGEAHEGAGRSPLR